jgi:hypothetical protein
VYTFSLDVPSDLDALAALCSRHVGAARAAAPEICALGSTRSRLEESSNAMTTMSSFEFSCQGSRDEVIATIGGFSRLVVTTAFE